MSKLYEDSLLKFQKWFEEAAKLHGIQVKYRYIVERAKEQATGESIYSKLSESINIDVVIESGMPKIDSLKQLGWFTDSKTDEYSLLVDFPISTPNLQEGCRFTLNSNTNSKQNIEYTIIKLSSDQLYTSCIKCLCIPVMKNNSKVEDDNSIFYGQQDILSDEENYTFINDAPNITIF